MEEEIIARRIRGILGLYITVIVLGALITLVSIAPFVLRQWMEGIYFLVMGMLFLGMGIGITAWWSTIPRVLIKYSDGKLYLSGGVVCYPSEVDFCTSCSYWTGYGSLVISVAQKQYKFKYTSRVDKAANRINELVAIDKAQKEIAERKAAENAETMEK
ncbi:MAG: hypothetical protein K2K60_02245 [Clostridia bacterium]|nr:hypothetical protein [Clostridia bacterium]